MKPASGPKPSSAYWKMPLSSGFFAPRLFSDSARVAKPMPTTSHAISTAPGLATPASWPVMANTPEPIHELTTIPISPNRPMPLAFSLMISLLNRNHVVGVAPGLRAVSRTYRTCSGCVAAQARAERRGETRQTVQKRRPRAAGKLPKGCRRKPASLAAND